MLCLGYSGRLTNSLQKDDRNMDETNVGLRYTDGEPEEKEK